MNETSEQVLERLNSPEARKKQAKYLMDYLRAARGQMTPGEEKSYFQKLRNGT